MPTSLVPLDDPAIRVIEHIDIPMPDGIRLAARIFLPSTAGERPAGAVLELLPYRKRDGYRPRDNVAGPSLAKGGIAYVRVDVRGTGDSEGICIDEYRPPEQQDAIDLIAWIAAQPWCNGRVGMRGISYSAFNSLQAAAKAPAALKAIMPCCGTEERYTDDVHYKGGCPVYDQLVWGVAWQGVMRSPPDPEIVGDRWRSMWLERLEAAEPVALKWVENHTPDYWECGTIRDYGQFQTPIYHVAGVLDGYVNSPVRIMERAPQVPQFAIFGPWAHKWPGYPGGKDDPMRFGRPGPAVDWMPVELAYWRHWLNEEPSDLMRGPRIWAFRHELPAAAVYPKDAPGEWVCEKSWPPQSVVQRTFHLNPEGLAEAPGAELRLAHRTDLTIGFATRSWYPTAVPDELWLEQSGDDERSMTFDTEPLRETIDILGTPELHLRIRADKPVAKVVGRLCHVDESGLSHLVSHFVLNLTHRDGSDRMRPIEPGEDMDVVIRGLYCCYRFKPGSRIRLSISETWWPVLWPSPEIVTLELTTGVSRLVLPTRDSALPSVEPPFEIVRDKFLDDRAFDGIYRAGVLKGVDIAGEASGRRLALTENGSLGGPELIRDTRILLGDGYRMTRSINEGDPTSAAIEIDYAVSYTRDDWQVEIRTSARMSSTGTDFLMEETLEALEGGRRVFSRNWKAAIPRRLV